MEWALAVVSVALLAACGLCAYLGRALNEANARFFKFADENSDRWARSHSDLSDKVLSHSDDFLRMKSIEAEATETIKPSPRMSIAKQHDIRNPGFDPDGMAINAG